MVNKETLRIGSIITILGVVCAAIFAFIITNLEFSLLESLLWYYIGIGVMSSILYVGLTVLAFGFAQNN